MERGRAITVFCVGIRTTILEQLDEIQIGAIPTAESSVQERDLV
jgi:hypothetical protein